MLESGHSFLDYQIVKPLAENQIYQSYLATHPEQGDVRLLLIDSDQLPGNKERHSFLDQAARLLGQSFPGFCTLLAAEATEDQSYCVFPVPSGQPLEELLEVGFTPRRSLELIRQIALALSLAHNSGLWHGNLSSSTVYLDAENISLADFALTSMIRLDFHSGADPRYTSPELVCGEQLSQASDLYSLGIIFYRLLTGRVPFDQGEPFATAMQHMQGEAAPLPERLVLYQPVLDGLLQSLPDERFTAEELMAELDRLLAMPDDQLFEPSPEADSLPAAGEPGQEPEGSQAVQLAESPASGSQQGAGEKEFSAIERLMTKSDMAMRVEQRLKDRAEALQASGGMKSDANRANAERMAAIGRQRHEKNMSMKRIDYTQKAGAGGRRFVLLTVLGVAVGVILYFGLFGQGSDSRRQVEVALPAELTAGLEQGSELLQSGKLAEAEQIFLELLKNYSFHPQPYNNLASVYATQGDLERARTYLEKALATDESYAMVYRNLGTVYSEMARDSYGRALQLEKGQQSVRLQLFPGNATVTVAAVGGPPPSSINPVETQAAVAKPPAMEAESEPLAEQEPAIQQSETISEEPAIEPPEIIAAKPLAAEKEPQPLEEPAAETVTEVVLKPEPETAEAFLQRWAAAWSSQEVEAYLAFYAEGFIPSSGQKRKDWEERRRTRLTAPKMIEIVLADFSLVRQSADRLEIEVTQSYKSDRYADKTRKLFDLVKKENSWQIRRERSLGRVR